MNGIQLAKSYYDAYGAELLAQFPELQNKVALGIAGSGSECLGYDDEVSQDHDFEPGFCIFAFVEDGAESALVGASGGKALTRKEAFTLERAYAKLPKEFQGFERAKMAPVGGNRRGLVDLREFLLQTTGTPDGVLTPEQWLQVPEESLLEATNGQVWQDAGGVFTPIRERLSYLPEDVRRKKLAGCLLPGSTTICAASGTARPAQPSWPASTLRKMRSMRRTCWKSATCPITSGRSAACAVWATSARSWRTIWRGSSRRATTPRRRSRNISSSRISLPGSSTG